MPLIQKDDSQKTGVSGASADICRAAPEQKCSKISASASHARHFLTERAGGVQESQHAEQRANSGYDPEGGANAVPARGLVTRTRAASDPASPALRPGREELASKRGCSGASRCRLR